MTLEGRCDFCKRYGCWKGGLYRKREEARSRPKDWAALFPWNVEKLPPDCNFSSTVLAEYGIETRFACPRCFRNKPDRELQEWEIKREEFIPHYELWEPKEEELRPPLLNHPPYTSRGESQIIKYYKKYGIKVWYVEGEGKRTIFAVKPSEAGVGMYHSPPNSKKIYVGLNKLLVNCWEIVHPKYVWDSLVKRIEYAWGKVHREYVEYALREEKNVPEEVLRDYPELKRRVEQTK